MTTRGRLADTFKAALYKRSGLLLAVLLISISTLSAIPQKTSAAPSPSLIFSNGSAYIVVTYGGDSSKFSEGSSGGGTAPVKYGAPNPTIKVSGSGCSGTITVPQSTIQAGKGSATLSNVKCGSQTFNGNYSIGDQNTTPGTPSPQSQPKIDWSGAKAALNSGGTQLTVTFKDGSQVVFYNQDPGKGKTYQPQPITGSNLSLGGATLSKWCDNTQTTTGQVNNTGKGITVSGFNSKSATGSVDVCYFVGATGVNQTANISVDTSAYNPDAANATSDGPPTCEASGFSLSWILCPIIDGMAHAVDGIYKNIVHPLLITQPIEFTKSDNTPTDTFKVWSNFRIYGDIFLVIALLVIVFGESIGGGMIDSYTAKKVLPRLLIAAVLINLSIYLVALAVDVTNIIGNGIEALIEAPFKDAGAFKIHIGGAAGDVGMGLLLGSGGIIWGLAHGASNFAPALLEFLAFVVVLPAFLTFMAILVTVILRRGLILFLVLVSPVAFALYCLPNTEQYFRKWWDWLWRTLMVYPIIAAAFAIGNVLSVTISSTSNGLIDGTIAQLLSIIALFVPLLLIPYSFRIAGGILGRSHDAVTGVRDRAHKMTEGRRQRAQSHLQRASIQGRQQWYSGLQESASKGGAFRRRSLGGLARVVGGYNIEARSSAVNAEIGKELNDQIATGKDDEIRGLAVDKRTAQSRTTADGVRQFKSLGGAWINEADVDAGHRRWGGNAYAMQAALAYEMRKADTEEDVQNIADNYHNVAQAAGLTDQQAAGAWIGAAFQQQDKHLQFKYTNWQTGQMSADQREGFLSEVYEKRGSYNMAQMHAKTIDQVIQANAAARQVLATGQVDGRAATAGELDQARRTQTQAAGIAESFVSRWGGRGGVGGEEAELEARTAAAAAAGGGALEPTIQTNTPGAAHVAQKVRQLAVETGVYQQLDPATDVRPPAGQAPPPIDRLN